MAQLSIPDPTTLTFNEWYTRLVEDNSTNDNLPVTPPPEREWRTYGNLIAFEDFRYPGTQQYITWKDWAKVLYELEIS